MMTSDGHPEKMTSDEPGHPEKMTSDGPRHPEKMTSDEPRHPEKMTSESEVETVGSESSLSSSGDLLSALARVEHLEFWRLDEEGQQRVVNSLVMREAEEGEALAVRGERPRGCFLVTSDHQAVNRRTGKLLEAGDLVGSETLLFDGALSEETVDCVDAAPPVAFLPRMSPPWEGYAERARAHLLRGLRAHHQLFEEGDVCTAGLACVLAGSLLDADERLLFPGHRGRGDLVALTEGALVTFDVPREELPAAEEVPPALSILERVRVAPLEVSGYRAVSLLGQGSCARVFLCVKGGKHFAMKVLKRGRAAAREAGVLSRLRHPNIVRLREVIDDGRSLHLYLIMDHVPAGCVRAGERRYSCLEVRRCARDVASGLAYMTKRGIVHGDIKPENLLQGDPFVIADFGSVHGRGTPAYEAPEVYAGGPPTAASDVWALGVTLFFMAQGYPPFRGSHRPVGEAASREDVVLRLEGRGAVPAENLLHRMLTKAVSRRITIAGILNHEAIKNL